jgi:hypothetical protein
LLSPRAEESITLEELAGTQGVPSELDLLQKDTHDREAAADESIRLSPEWERYFGVICVVTDAMLPVKKREPAKDAALGQCRLGGAQKVAPPPVPAELGTPEELRRRWRRGEIEMRAVAATNRREHVIEIREYFVPDEPEDDQPDEGYWEGLRWLRHKPDTGS